jgi:phytoene synthase
MQDVFAHCEALVRTADKDRFLATLFAPAEHRNALFALYAFNLEVARVREVVREPLAGEIRLQWWIDLLAGTARGEAEGHPVAAAVLASMARYRLPPQLFEAIIAARRFDLYDEPMATLAELEAYAEGTSGGLLALATEVLDRDRAHAPAMGALIRHAGLAHAIAGLLKALPVHADRGQLFVPREVLERHGSDAQQVAAGQATPQLRAALAELRGRARAHLDEAQTLLPAAGRDVLPALLPVALTGPTLALMERPDHDPFAPVELPAWRRQWLIWRAAKQPARIFR